MILEKKIKLIILFGFIIAMLYLQNTVFALCEEPDIYPIDPTLKECSNDTLTEYFNVTINETSCLKEISFDCLYGCNNKTMECYTFEQEDEIMPHIFSMVLIFLFFCIVLILLNKGGKI